MIELTPYNRTAGKKRSTAFGQPSEETAGESLRVGWWKVALELPDGSG